MARPLRMEFEGGIYHVINRGNYRAPVFRGEKTRAAFLKCLSEACEKTGWRVHAWCMMSNHYHLALETPRGNLVEGMTWLQGTFATRFNRLRREQGHLFQGRYKSMLVESGERLGALCHYIHLNPVRAEACTIGELPHWRWCSASWLQDPSLRSTWYDPMQGLLHAGQLPDTPKGRSSYFDYLAWLSEDEPAQKALRFEQMSKGWVLGSDSFRKDMFVEHRDLAARRELGCDEMFEAREHARQELLDELLEGVGRGREDLAREGKFAEWKVALAAAMKVRTTVTNRWLSQNLAMGSLHEVSRQVAARLRSPGRNAG